MHSPIPPTIPTGHVSVITSRPCTLAGDLYRFGVPVVKYSYLNGNGCVVMPAWANTLRLLTFSGGSARGRAFRAFATGDDEWRAAAFTVLDLGGVGALNEFTKRRREKAKVTK